jgi:hypothetical protein
MVAQTKTQTNGQEFSEEANNGMRLSAMDKPIFEEILLLCCEMYNQYLFLNININNNKLTTKSRGTAKDKHQNSQNNL